MTDDTTGGQADEFGIIRAPSQRSKPRIALMGEFSAGKSTLSNIMIGSNAIPTRITATRLPPVWMHWGSEPAWREDAAGQRHEIDTQRLEDVPLADTAFIHLYLEAEVLEVCDLIDTPGISDPNMPPEVWERAADAADGVLWLTHATQAWRQSEAAVWETMPVELYANSLLLVTRIDKLTGQHDRDRVMARVRAEAGAHFAHVLPISLTEALAAGDDQSRWIASGGEDFSAALLTILDKVQRRLRLSVSRARRRGAAPAAMASQPGPAEIARRRQLHVPAAAPVAPAPNHHPASSPGPDRALGTDQAGQMGYPAGPAGTEAASPHHWSRASAPTDTLPKTVAQRPAADRGTLEKALSRRDAAQSQPASRSAEAAQGQVATLPPPDTGQSARPGSLAKAVEAALSQPDPRPSAKIVHLRPLPPRQASGQPGPAPGATGGTGSEPDPDPSPGPGTPGPRRVDRDRRPTRDQRPLPTE